jgi:hypothetical protein
MVDVSPKFSATCFFLLSKPVPHCSILLISKPTLRRDVIKVTKSVREQSKMKAGRQFENKAANFLPYETMLVMSALSWPLCLITFRLMPLMVQVWNTSDTIPLGGLRRHVRTY